MRGKQQQHPPPPRLPPVGGGGIGVVGSNDVMDPDDYVATVKTRAPTPVMGSDGGPAGGGGGGFWLAAVTAAGGGGAGTGSGGVLPLDAETGFINSQPSMAEFMTALPHLAGGGAGTGDLHVPPTSAAMSPGGYPPGMGVDHGPPQPPHGQPGVNVPEYPWMKEKKTTRKSNQQGKTFENLYIPL